MTASLPLPDDLPPETPGDEVAPAKPRAVEPLAPPAASDAPDAAAPAAPKKPAPRRTPARTTAAKRPSTPRPAGSTAAKRTPRAAAGDGASRTPAKKPAAPRRPAAKKSAPATPENVETTAAPTPEGTAAAPLVPGPPPPLPDDIVIPPRPPLPPVVDPTPESASEPEPDAVVTREPEPEVVVEPEPQTVVEPQPEVIVEPEPEPELFLEPEVIVEPEPEPEPEPVATVETEPKPELVLEPEPEAIAAPDPESIGVVDPDAAELVASGLDIDTTAAALVPALEIVDVTKSFGGSVAVDAVGFTVPAGSFYGIVGPNGAGKTTTLSMIAGLLKPDAGTIRVNGVDVRADAARAKRAMGVLPDRLRTFDRLTGRQLLYYYGVLRGLPAAVVESRIGDLARAFDLVDALGRKVSDYSAGMTKKVMLAGAMIHSPRLLVLDEPFESVDPVSSAVILDILGTYVEHGGTVILSSHGMDLVERVCSRVAVLVAGQLLAEGTVEEVRGAGTLQERFVELSGGLGDVEGLEWLHTFSD